MCRIVLNHTPDLFQAPRKEKDLSLTDTFGSREFSYRSTSSQRSKFLSNSRLGKSNLFSAIRGKKSTAHKENMRELTLQLEILEDSLSLTALNMESQVHQIQSEFRNYKNECRKMLRAL